MPQHILNELLSVYYEQRNSLHYRVYYNSFHVVDNTNYGKPYSVKNFFARNKQIAIHSEYVVAFIPRGVKSNGSMSTIKYAKKFGKNTLVIN